MVHTFDTCAGYRAQRVDQHRRFLHDQVCLSQALQGAVETDGRLLGSGVCMALCMLWVQLSALFMVSTARGKLEDNDITLLCIF